MTIILAASLIPPLFLLWKVYEHDKIEKEPFGLLLTIFLFGMVSTLPAGLLESAGMLVLNRIIPQSGNTRLFNLIFYFIVVGGAEELVKFFAMKIPTWKNPEFDYVFDGEGTAPWQPDCKDYAPLCVYGDSKLKGEQAVSEILDKYFIVRIAWVFGRNGNNFIKTMLKVGKKFDTVRVVNDQIGTPTYTFDLAKLLSDMCESEKYGYYHATNEGGYISWYDFTKEIYKQAGYTTNVVPVTTEEYGLSKAKRPHNSRLDKSKLTENRFALLPTWQDALSRYLKEIEY